MDIDTIKQNLQQAFASLHLPGNGYGQQVEQHLRRMALRHTSNMMKGLKLPLSTGGPSEWQALFYIAEELAESFLAFHGARLWPEDDDSTNPSISQKGKGLVSYYLALLQLPVNSPTHVMTVPPLAPWRIGGTNSNQRANSSYRARIIQTVRRASLGGCVEHAGAVDLWGERIIDQLLHIPIADLIAGTGPSIVNDNVQARISRTDQRRAGSNSRRASYDQWQREGSAYSRGVSRGRQDLADARGDSVIGDNSLTSSAGPQENRPAMEQIVRQTQELALDADEGSSELSGSHGDDEAFEEGSDVSSEDWHLICNIPVPVGGVDVECGVRCSSHRDLRRHHLEVHGVDGT